MMYIRMPKEQKEEIIGRIQSFFLEERDEEIGHLAAELLMDFILREVGPYLYNQAVSDAQTLVMQKMASMDEDMGALKLRIER